MAHTKVRSNVGGGSKSRRRYEVRAEVKADARVVRTQEKRSVEREALAAYEGFFSRLTCEQCEEVFDVEGDVSNNEEVRCDACGVALKVSGR